MNISQEKEQEYQYIKDIGCDKGMSLEEYSTREGDLYEYLQEQNILISTERKEGIEELLLLIQECLPNFEYSFENENHIQGTVGDLPGVNIDNEWHSLYKGHICGEHVDSTCTFPEFIPDVVNPILSKKFGKQFLFSFPGSNDYTFVLVDDTHVDQVKTSRFFEGGTYEDMEKWYAYKKY